MISPDEYSTGSATNVSMLFGSFASYRGNKHYEMSNHLGNVLTVISDKKTAICSTGVFSYFKPEVISATDYSPFGAPLAGRTYQMSEYRFGFNGKEKIDEVYGAGNQIDMGDRWFDVRLGRTSKLDAKCSKFPALSPYSFAANNPIFFIDPDGKVIRVHYVENGVDKYYTYKPGIKPTTNNTFVQQVHEAVTDVMKNDANKTFQNISDSKETVTFNEIKTHDDETKGKINKTRTKVTDVKINWNPTIALQTTNGGALTPATALLHEGAHAERYINADTKEEVKALQNDLADVGTVYDKPEEKRVIDNIETPYINATNRNQPFSIMVTLQQEGTRTDHRGTTYQSTGVNSITPANGSKQKGQSVPSETAKKMVAPADNAQASQPIIRR